MHVVSVHNTAPDDYTSVTNQQLTFGPGTTSIPVDIPIVNDNIVELEEQFTASLSLGTTASNVQVDPDLATISITDDDGKTIIM